MSDQLPEACSSGPPPPYSLVFTGCNVFFLKDCFSRSTRGSTAKNRVLMLRQAWLVSGFCKKLNERPKGGISLDLANELHTAFCQKSPFSGLNR